MYYNNIPYNNHGFNREFNRRVPTNGDRFIGGGFLLPFVLGGLAGGAIASSRPPVYYMPPPMIPPMYYRPPFSNYNVDFNNYDVNFYNR